MSITGYDVAKRLGISQPTVSRALSGRGLRMSAKTRQLVIETAYEMGYRPNVLARSLRSRKTDTIGFYVEPCLTDGAQYFPPQGWQAIKQTCEEHRLDLLIHIHRADNSSDAIYDEIAGGRTDGALVYLCTDSPLLPLLQRSHLPIVSIGEVLPGIPSVSGLSDGLPWIEVIHTAVDLLVERIAAQT